MSKNSADICDGRDIVDRLPGDICITQNNCRERTRLRLRDGSIISVYIAKTRRKAENRDTATYLAVSGRWHFSSRAVLC
jgi:hypothetical protein